MNFAIIIDIIRNRLCQLQLISIPYPSPCVFLHVHTYTFRGVRTKLWGIVTESSHNLLASFLLPIKITTWINTLLTLLLDRATANLTAFEKWEGGDLLNGRLTKGYHPILIGLDMRKTNNRKAALFNRLNKMIYFPIVIWWAEKKPRRHNFRKFWSPPTAYTFSEYWGTSINHMVIFWVFLTPSPFVVTFTKKVLYNKWSFC